MKTLTASDVREQRKDANLTQGTVAKALGWNTETLVDIERRRITVTNDALVQVSEVITKLSEQSANKEAAAA